MIGAEILNELELDAENRAVFLGGDFVVIHVAAAVNSASEVFATALDPLHRLADLHRDETHQGLFGVNVQLAAESAADFGRNHAQPVFFQAEHLRHQRPHQMGNLRGCVQREGAIARQPLRDHASGFHGGRDQPLAGDALLDDHFGFGERLVDVAAVLVVVECRVIGPFRMYGGGARREGFLWIGDRGQRLPFHFDRFGGVARDVAIGGNDHGNRMADEVHAIDRQDIVMRNTQAGQGSAARHGADFFGVFSGEDRSDARELERWFDVDRFDFGRAMRTAHDAGVVHAGHLDVVDVGGGAGDEARILAAADALAN